MSASAPVNLGPPVLMLGQPLLTPILPVHQHSRPALIAVANGLLRVIEIFQIPIAPDSRVQDFVSPIIILEQNRQSIIGSLSYFPFKSLAVFGHEPLLDEV